MLLHPYAILAADTTVDGILSHLVWFTPVVAAHTPICVHLQQVAYFCRTGTKWHSRSGRGGVQKVSAVTHRFGSAGETSAEAVEVEIAWVPPTLTGSLNVLKFTCKGALQQHNTHPHAAALWRSIGSLTTLTLWLNKTNKPVVTDTL